MCVFCDRLPIKKILTGIYHLIFLSNTLFFNTTMLTSAVNRVKAAKVHQKFCDRSGSVCDRLSSDPE